MRSNIAAAAFALTMATACMNPPARQEREPNAGERFAWNAPAVALATAVGCAEAREPGAVFFDATPDWIEDGRRFVWEVRLIGPEAVTQVQIDGTSGEELRTHRTAAGSAAMQLWHSSRADAANHSVPASTSIAAATTHVSGSWAFGAQLQLEHGTLVYLVALQRDDQWLVAAVSENDGTILQVGLADEQDATSRER